MPVMGGWRDTVVADFLAAERWEAQGEGQERSESESAGRTGPLVSGAAVGDRRLGGGGGGAAAATVACLTKIVVEAAFLSIVDVTDPGACFCTGGGGGGGGQEGDAAVFFPAAALGEGEGTVEEVAAAVVGRGFGGGDGGER